MSTLQCKIGKNKVYQQVLNNKSIFVAPDKVINSWYDSFNYKQEDIERNIEGLRSPQLGALYAIKSHWSVSKEVATIVMPTGERVIIVMGAIYVIKSRVSETLTKYNSCIA
ncbi:hypothetical protein SAMN02745248_02241 [Hathewaya proteolytica DSM 3090]|uniref:Uncharacterized protein n=1 Tax=Hathewaya proteolytica DSM 3090 TaxID=1121331 RepID=A0A1M6RB50_9CLOT|nr:hypothetical protein [Hathewaya proteolytica]SHK29693.1 hypothetical protein SAMN02745248_02241 [Hathewaya proteolytica DSM 3090]